MKGITKLFFYYSLLVTTFVCLSSLVILDSPYNFIFMIILLPTVLFNWLRFTDPTGATETEWSSRIFVVLITLLILFGFSYYLYSAKPKDVAIVDNSQSDLIASMSAMIKTLEKKIDEESNIQEVESTSSAILDKNILDDLLKSLPSSTPSPSTSPNNDVNISGNIKIISNEPINIYETNSTSSRIMGIAEPESKYAFSQKSQQWYLIKFGDSRTGWIEAKEVVEL